jgi:hypothetical protein
MAERVWTELDAAAADGLACVVCGRDFRLRRSPARRPVGRSHTGSQVFACVGECTSRAAATPERVTITSELHAGVSRPAPMALPPPLTSNNSSHSLSSSRARF